MSQNQGPGQNEDEKEHEDRSGSEMEGWPLQTGWLGSAVVATNPLVFHNPYAAGNSQDQCAALKKIEPKTKTPKVQSGWRNLFHFY